AAASAGPPSLAASPSAGGASSEATPPLSRIFCALALAGGGESEKCRTPLASVHEYMSAASAGRQAARRTSRGQERFMGTFDSWNGAAWGRRTGDWIAPVAARHKQKTAKLRITVHSAASPAQ